MHTPTIDYTNLGYASLREAMLGLAAETLPEWTDHSENDLGVALVELFAYACDITLYYQDRIAANLFPDTADEPDALVRLLRLIGYELSPPTPAVADLRLAFDADRVATLSAIDLPAGTGFDVTGSAGRGLRFETPGPVRIHTARLTPPDDRGLRHFEPLSVVEGRTREIDPLGVSDGSPGQRYALEGSPVIAGSIQVTVREPGGVSSRWSEVAGLADSTPADHHFTVQRDAGGQATLLFGDGRNGRVPPRGTALEPVVISARYRVGGGSAGNLAANSAFRSESDLIASAVNPRAAAGGGPGEGLDRARRMAPRLFRAQERAVTLQDHLDLALRVPGVGKAHAVALGGNRVLLYVAPGGQVAEPSELLRRDLLAAFEAYRMAGTAIEVVGPQPADIYLRADIRAQPYFLQSAVRSAVEQAMADYLAFDSIEFGQSLYLSKVYDAIQGLEEVASLTVTQFSREPGGGLSGDGIIRLEPWELPRPGYRDNPDSLPPSGVATPIVLAIEGGVPE